jgi:hypothetical protein
MSNKRKPASAKVRVTSAATDRVVLAYIHPGETSAYFTQSLVNLLMWDQATSRRVVGCINEWSSANVSSSRNALTAQFLDEYDAEWLLWIDADMAFEHEALDRLIASADPKTHPIVGGLCFGMSAGALFPTIYQFMKTDEGGLTTIRVGEYPDDSLVPCAATGAAFVLIHRTVLESVREKRYSAGFPWFQETEVGGKPAGEDITFCIRATLLGFPIHVDTSVKVGHHKSTLLDHAMFQAQREALADGTPDVGRSED